MQRMSDVVKAAKITVIVTSALLLCAGLFIAFWGNGDSEVVRILVGIVAILTGATRIFGYFSNDLYRLAFQTGFAEGAFLIVIGVLFLLTSSGLFLVFPYAIAIYVILDGMLKLQTALDARVFGMHNWPILLASAILVIVLGIVTVVLTGYGFDTRILSGISLAAVGADSMWETMYTVRIRAKKYMQASEFPSHLMDENK